MGQNLISPDHFQMLVEMIKNFETLSDNWDNCAALKLESKTITRTVRLLHTLFEHNILGYHSDPPFAYSPDENVREQIFQDIKECNAGTSEVWQYMNELIPTVSYGDLNFSPTRVGGISLSWAQNNKLGMVTMPPEGDQQILYSFGYVDEAEDRPEYIEEEKGLTNDYNVVAQLVKTHIGC